jgi:hypothetical protein
MAHLVVIQQTPKLTDTYTCIHTYMHTCMHVYIHTYIHTYDACIHTYVTVTNSMCLFRFQLLSIDSYIHTIHSHMHTYIHVRTRNLPTPTQIRMIYMHTCIHAYIHTYTCSHANTHKRSSGTSPTRTHTYILTYVHTYIHTYTHTCIKTYTYWRTNTHQCSPRPFPARTRRARDSGHANQALPQQPGHARRSLGARVRRHIAQDRHWRQRALLRQERRAPFA